MDTKRLFFVVTAVLTSLLAAFPVLAQSVAPARDPYPAVEDDSPKNAYLYGTGLGLGGFLLGGAIGIGVASGCSGDDQCQLAGAFYGAAIGGTLGMAIGVHLGNDRRGNIALDMLTGAAIWGAGIVVAAASDWNSTVTTLAFIAIPIAQLVTTVAVERAVGRSRASQPDIFVSMGPDLKGGATLVVSLRF